MTKELQPQLTAIDLSKTVAYRLGADHPDIRTDRFYLAVRDGRLLCGQFQRREGQLYFSAGAYPVTPMCVPDHPSARFNTTPVQALWEIENADELAKTNLPSVTEADWLRQLPDEIEVYQVADALFDNGWYYDLRRDHVCPNSPEAEAYEALRDTFPAAVGPFETRAAAAEHCARALGARPRAIEIAEG